MKEEELIDNFDISSVDNKKNIVIKTIFYYNNYYY